MGGLKTAGAVRGGEDRTFSEPAPSITALIENMLLDEYAPVSVVANNRGEVVYIHGRTGAYLEPAPGRPNLVLVNMAREGLRYDLAAALHQAAGQSSEVVRTGLKVKANGTYILVDLKVKRILEPEPLRGLMLVTFDTREQEPRVSGKKKKTETVQHAPPPPPGIIEELRYTKQRLQHTIEELQTSNEELKSTNEELQSTNEELQSSNEELETSKEELQSLNEELVTVNAELEGKIEELGESNDDLHNLLNSTDIATIFLDNHLNIKRFTPAAKRVINLIPSDVGRPLADISSKIIDNQLIDKAQGVLRSLVFQESEVQAMDGEWYTLRILPYRTIRNTIDGLVITFLNITKTKTAGLSARDAQELTESMLQTIREPLIVLDGGLRVVKVNRAFYVTFLCSPAEVEQHLLYEVCGGEWNIPDLRRLLEEILPMDGVFQDFMMEYHFPKLGLKRFALNARRLEREPGKPHLILLAMQEVTEGRGLSEKASPGELK